MICLRVALPNFRSEQRFETRQLMVESYSARERQNPAKPRYQLPVERRIRNAGGQSCVPFHYLTHCFPNLRKNRLCPRAFFDFLQFSGASGRSAGVASFPPRYFRQVSF